MELLIAAAGLAASVLGVVGALPQLLRTACTRYGAGMSLTAESVLWAVYGLAHHDRAITLYAGFGLLAGLAVSSRLLVAAERIRLARGVLAGGIVPDGAAPELLVVDG